MSVVSRSVFIPFLNRAIVIPLCQSSGCFVSIILLKMVLSVSSRQFVCILKISAGIMSTPTDFIFCDFIAILTSFVVKRPLIRLCILLRLRSKDWSLELDLLVSIFLTMSVCSVSELVLSR